MESKLMSNITFALNPLMNYLLRLSEFICGIKGSDRLIQ